MFIYSIMRVSISKVLIIVALILPTIVVAQKQELSYTIATYNIKYDNPKDTVNAWNPRKKVIADLLRFNEVDIIGIQEGLSYQVEDLDSLLPDHAAIGVGRDDGAKKGEYSALLYNKNIFEVLDSNTFWLSPTPEVPSMGWDAAFPRICTWAALKVKKSNDIVFVFNTHFDHIGQNARKNSALLILKKIKEIAENNPVILMGDFNVKPTTEVYQLLQKNLLDAFTITTTPHFGPKATFNNFDFFKVPEQRIDFIFVNSFFTVLKHGILNNHYGLKYPSDHFPVITEVRFSID